MVSVKRLRIPSQIHWENRASYNISLGCSAFLITIMASQSNIPDKINSPEMFDHFLKPVIKKMNPIQEKKANKRNGIMESSLGKNS